MDLGYRELRYGQFSLLAQLTGFESSQFSAWVHTERKMSLESARKISDATGVAVEVVRQAFDDRKAEEQMLKEINRRIRNVINQRLTLSP